MTDARYSFTRTRERPIEAFAIYEGSVKIAEAYTEPDAARIADALNTVDPAAHMIAVAPADTDHTLLTALEAIARCGHAYFDRDQKKLDAMIHLADTALARVRAQ